ncbi:hypothetical protein P152DRAFT_393287 [Eremomyces bilateralis CBS 781.70]|uniref:Uncharacterized protein n=1 Tax=Eremomyces bilateralis CBS 781.70 TaxID=1392243 RepID=A0A6G1G860_9PEZI|nr:uncharacterized protein P152DRAFT_393287 [Eremomyces bilateralis CBS 781.70]KAF1814111.1 hypothetical protein P152DRAFT_393287 [Eremomyces bilateralis CBS 781.70]
MRVARTHKDIVEAAAVSAYRLNFEAARSFDLEDDELFCPFSLLTDEDLTSMHSSGSDRSSLSSGSPEQSPLQHQLQPTPAFMLPASTYLQSLSSQHPSSTKIHQPIAQRSSGKAIPIVNPATRNIASPPPSISPARQMVGRVW